MAFSRHYADAAAGGKQRGFTLHFHQDFAGENVEKLLRLLVVVASFGGARGHELLDHAELFVVDQIPGVAIGSPAIVLGVFPAHGPGPPELVAETRSGGAC